MKIISTCYAIGIISTIILLIVIIIKTKNKRLVYEKKIYTICKNWINDKERSYIDKIIICGTLGLTFSIIILIAYHSFLDLYNSHIIYKFLNITKPNADALNIAELGDSLAVLSFIALIMSLMMTIFALRQQSKDLQLTQKEMRLNREEAEEANKLRERSEVLENIRLLAGNTTKVKRSSTLTDEPGEKWTSSTVCEIVQSNLSQLIESSLEVLVKITRDNKEGLLRDLAVKIINKNRLTLTYKNFENARLFLANLQGSRFIGANLQNANLASAKLQNSSFINANLESTDLGMAFLQDTNLFNANLKNAHLVEAKLQRAFLNGAQLVNANLNSANLESANLFRTDLTQANLEHANITDALFMKANLKNVKVQASQLIVTKSLYKVKNLDPTIETEIRDRGFSHLIDKMHVDYNE